MPIRLGDGRCRYLERRTLKRHTRRRGTGAGWLCLVRVEYFPRRTESLREYCGIWLCAVLHRCAKAKQRASLVFY